MKDSARRKWVKDPGIPGRGIWMGLAASIALHAALLSTVTSPIQESGQPHVLEARLEVQEPRPPLPDVSDVAEEAAKQSHEPAQSPAQTTTKPETEPEPDAAPQDQSSAENTPAEMAVPAAPQAEEKLPAQLPLSSLEHPPQAQRPHAALSSAANNLQQLPRKIRISFVLQGLINGKQTHIWQRESQSYTLETLSEATGIAGIFLSGKMTQKSSGRISELGLIPERYEMLRLNGKQEILVFNYPASMIEVSRIDPKKGKRTSELPLMMGTQDPLSSIYQLAMLAQSGNDGLIVTAGTKRVKGYPYRIVGLESLKTALGEMKTLHVTRADDSSTGGVHLWLSREKHFMPVKISYFDDDGKEWILQAVEISLE